ncbi:hypothetical protein OCS65_18305 [Rhodococcus aetherivorans]|uniref:Uncharacterized protein n=1 Tax=Rhodococcus aetherivorans TaxID=191292 RepID=A0AA46S9F9_9NOCA|nr:hypothetical protein [Rhodococcus aetherivorans]UYF92433.1 hypothetical protein OCS65_18305 [Rhodococcus aetherivorans]
MRDAQDPGNGHYDDDGNYVFPHGGGVLTPTGVILDNDRQAIYGSRRWFIDAETKKLRPYPPASDGADPQPLPPLVPIGHDWPTPPAGAGWPNL